MSTINIITLTNWIIEKQLKYCPPSSYKSLSNREIVHYPVSDGLIDIELAKENKYSKVYSIINDAENSENMIIDLVKVENIGNNINIFKMSIDEFLTNNYPKINKSLIVVEFKNAKISEINYYVKKIIELKCPLLFIIVPQKLKNITFDSCNIDILDLSENEIVICLRKKNIGICLKKHQHQITTLIKNEKMKNTLMKFLSGKFYNEKLIFNNIKYYFNALKQETYDKKIYDKLHEIVFSKNGSKNEKSDNSSFDKSEYVATQIMTFLKGKLKTRIHSYLDIGCAEGSLTIALGEKLKLAPLNIYGCDIRDIGISKKFQFSVIKNNILPFENNSISLISVIMVLHHIEDLELMLNEIFRVLEPGGYLLIKEHDCNSSEFSNFIDIVHGLYSLSLSNPIEDFTFCENYYANYKSEYMWKKILMKNRYDHSSYYVFPKFRNSLQRWYYSLLRKK